MNSPFIIAQISDLHVTPAGVPAYGVADTAAPVRLLVEYLNGLAPRPAAVLATGDLTDGGTPESCIHLAELLAPLELPLFLTPGNHDPKDHLKAAFPQHPHLRETLREDDGLDYSCYCVEEFPLRLVGLDSVTPGRHGGGLGPRRLKWLAETLAAAPTRPTLVFLHHPPFASHFGHMDRSPFVGRAELAAIIEGHPQVHRLACGHLHRTIFRRFGGTLVVSSPSVSLAIPADLRPEAPSAFQMEPPGFLLHCLADPWGDGPELTSHQVQLPASGLTFSGPHPFSE